MGENGEQWGTRGDKTSERRAHHSRQGNKKGDGRQWKTTRGDKTLGRRTRHPTQTQIVGRLPEGVSHCTPDCSFPRVLSPLLLHCAPSCFLLPRVLSPSVSACAPSHFPLLAGVSAFPSILPPFSPHYLLSCPPNSVLL